MQVLKLSESLDSREILMTATFALKHSKFSRRTFYAQQLLERVHASVMGLLIEGYWGEKYCLLFIDEMSRKALIEIPI